MFRMEFKKETKIKALVSISIIIITAVTVSTIAVLKNNEVKRRNKSEREVILITGGTNKNGSLSSVELFIPETNQICLLPPMTHSRHLHSQNQFLACGGGGKTSGSSCEEFNPKLGQWNLRTSPLIRNRRGHSSWSLTNGSVILLGGIPTGMHDVKENIAELVSPGLQSVRSLLLNESML